MKKIIFTLILIFTLSVSVSAKIVDNERLLTTSEQNTLSSRIEAISDAHDCEIIIYTEDFGQYATAEMSARAILEQSGTDNGVIFYVAMGSRDWHVFTVGESWNLFNSRAMDEIENEAVPYLSSGEYYAAFNKFLDIAEDVYTFADEGKSYSPPKKTSELLFGIGVAGVLALVVAIIWVLSLKSKLTTVKMSHGAGNYQDAGSFKLSGSNDVFLYKNITRVAKPKSNGGGSFGGGGGGSRGGKF